MSWIAFNLNQIEGDPPQPWLSVEEDRIGKFVFGMNVSLDGYVDHDRFAPDPVLFRHWIDQVRETKVSLYGRKIYEIMRYFDEDQPGWGEAEREFAVAWRAQHKFVVSRTLASVGPNATLISEDIDGAIRGIKARHEGEIDVCGTVMAQGVGEAGLMDEYRLYLHPVVLGHGVPFFAGPRPRLRLTGSERFGGEVIRLTYVPA